MAEENIVKVDPKVESAEYSLDNRAVKAASRFLVKNWYQILETDKEYAGEHVDIIAFDRSENTIVFVQTRVKVDDGTGFGEEDYLLKDKKEFERMLIAFLAANPDSAPLGRYRLDFMDLVVTDAKHAALKHHHAVSSKVS